MRLHELNNLQNSITALAELKEKLLALKEDKFVFPEGEYKKMDKDTVLMRGDTRISVELLKFLNLSSFQKCVSIGYKSFHLVYQDRPGFQRELSLLLKCSQTPSTTNPSRYILSRLSPVATPFPRRRAIYLEVS